MSGREELDQLHDPFIAMAGGKKGYKKWAAAKRKALRTFNKTQNQSLKPAQGTQLDMDDRADGWGRGAQASGAPTELGSSMYPQDMMDRSPAGWTPDHLHEHDRLWRQTLEQA